MVVATQNPIEMEGTYPLPEAQRDRFMARLEMGYPARTSEVAMLTGQAAGDPMDVLSPVTDVAFIARAIRAVRDVWVAPIMNDYIVSLVEATRRSPDLRLGASPRASLHLMRASRAMAALSGRDYVIPEDVQQLAVMVLSHRVLLTVDAHVARVSKEDVIDDIVASIPRPAGS